MSCSNPVVNRSANSPENNRTLDIALKTVCQRGTLQADQQATRRSPSFLPDLGTPSIDRVRPYVVLSWPPPMYTSVWLDRPTEHWVQLMYEWAPTSEWRRLNMTGLAALPRPAVWCGRQVINRPTSVTEEHKPRYLRCHRNTNRQSTTASDGEVQASGRQLIGSAYQHIHAPRSSSITLCCGK